MDRSSTAYNAKRGKNAGRKLSRRQIQYSGPSFSNLPNSILENIILKLSIKTIFMCKSVCKMWHDLISDPEFAKLHFSQAQICPLLRSSGVTFISRMLYLVQPNQADFERKLDMCEHRYPRLSCDSCHVKVKIDMKLKLPLRNLERMLDDGDESGSKRDNSIKLKMKDHKYTVVNSCNGLLCLSEPSDNDPVIVCNPVTGEFINLPKARTVKLREPDYYPELRIIASGFGFSRTTNQYKVIRMFVNMDTTRRTPVMVTEVHILGGESWKNIGSFLFTKFKLFPTNLNGCIYWLSEESVIFFDIDKEQFGSVSLPLLRFNDRFTQAMGVLGGEIVLSEADNHEIDFWALKENGVNKSWSKLFSICKYIGIQAWPKGSFLPIMCLNDGALLMYNAFSNAFIYKDPKRFAYTYLKVGGVEAKLEAIPHIPSFIPLKDLLSGHDVQVHNVNSRCAHLKLHNEKKRPYIEAEGYVYGL